MKITDILEKGLSEEKESAKNKQISIVNLAEKNQQMGTLDSISVFKAFYSLGVFDKL